ncbi:hypothetical protein [Brucella anthropi]|uniref:hypothetical protein n=1 Tax=Brucella anthropi TaxID=529 RepID=UPI0011B0464C
MNIDFETILHLESSGVGFTVNVKVPMGGRSVYLNANEVSRYIKDKAAFSASHFGLTLEEYAEWIEMDGFVRCSETTTTGARCKNYVSGGSFYNPEEWKRLRGEYCAVHGGPASR